MAFLSWISLTTFLALTSRQLSMTTGAAVVGPHRLSSSAESVAEWIASSFELNSAIVPSTLSSAFNQRNQIARHKRDITARFLNSIESVEEAVQRSCQTAARMNSEQYATFERCSFKAQQPRYTVRDYQQGHKS